MPKYTLLINQESYTVDVEASAPLLWVLRDHLSLFGTKYGCGIGQCGCCTIHLNNDPAKSCLITVSAVGEKSITTIEGLSDSGNHPVQKTWVEFNVPQCGYCQTGQIMTAAAFLKKTPNPQDEDIDKAMSENICRCGTYPRIKEAIKSLAKTGDV